VRAAEHAHQAAASREAQQLEFLTAAEGKEVEAIASCIIPSDGTPGAREAGVVYFIDRALLTFSADQQKVYREGIPEIHKRLRQLFPAVTLFSAATPEQQVAGLLSLDVAGSESPPRRPRATFIAGTTHILFVTIRARTRRDFL